MLLNVLKVPQLLSREALAGSKPWFFQWVMLPSRLRAFGGRPEKETKWKNSWSVADHVIVSLWPLPGLACEQWLRKVGECVAGGWGRVEAPKTSAAFSDLPGPRGEQWPRPGISRKINRHFVAPCL